MANVNLRQSKEAQEANEEKRVQFEPTFASGDSFVIEKPQLSISLVELLTAERHTKLRPQQLAPYRTISVGPEYVKGWHDGIENTVSINCITTQLLAN